MKLKKNPNIYFYNLINNKCKLDDNKLYIYIRIFLNYHSDVFINYNLQDIINKLNGYNKSINVIIRFHKLSLEKNNILLLIKKWELIYHNHFFWNLTLEKQIIYLYSIKDRFYAFYDCSKGGTIYHMKLHSLLKSSNSIDIINNSIERLVYIFKMFGSDIFKCINIPIITVKTFNELSNENIILYFI